MWAALLSLCCVAPRAALGEDRAPYTVDALTQHALLHDPALRALHAEWQAALARSEAARRALPQPPLLLPICCCGATPLFDFLNP